MNSMQLLQLMVILLSIDIHLNQALYITNLSVPRIIDAKQKAKLFCSYEIGKHTLNSVKWYKDGQEFFRYSPLTPPTTNWFPVKGVTIADGSSHCNQFICNVELEKLNVHSSGSYRCEVSGDAPEFKLIDKTANMTVGILPKYDPFISGLQPIYRFGDFIVLNCSSEWSNPSASLTWYINNKTAPLTAIQPQINEITHNTNEFILYASTKQLRVHINDPRYITKNGALTLKCISDIMGITSIRRQTDVIVNILATQEAISRKQRLMGTTLTNIATNISPSTRNTIIAYHYILLVIIATIITTVTTIIIRTVRASIIDISSNCLLNCLINAIVTLIWPIYHYYPWDWS